MKTKTFSRSTTSLTFVKGNIYQTFNYIVLCSQTSSERLLGVIIHHPNQRRVGEHTAFDPSNCKPYFGEVSIISER